MTNKALVITGKYSRPVIERGVPFQRRQAKVDGQTRTFIDEFCPNCGGWMQSLYTAANQGRDLYACLNPVCIPVVIYRIRRTGPGERSIVCPSQDHALLNQIITKRGEIVAAGQRSAQNTLNQARRARRQVVELGKTAAQRLKDKENTLRGEEERIKNAAGASASPKPSRNGPRGAPTPVNVHIHGSGPSGQRSSSDSERSPWLQFGSKKWDLLFEDARTAVRGEGYIPDETALIELVPDIGEYDEPFLVAQKIKSKLIGLNTGGRLFDRPRSSSYEVVQQQPAQVGWGTKLMKGTFPAVAIMVVVFIIAVFFILKSYRDEVDSYSEMNSVAGTGAGQYQEATQEFNQVPAPTQALIFNVDPGMTCLYEFPGVTNPESLRASLETIHQTNDPVKSQQLLALYLNTVGEAEIGQPQAPDGTGAELLANYSTDITVLRLWIIAGSLIPITGQNPVCPAGWQ